MISGDRNIDKPLGGERKSPTPRSMRWKPEQLLYGILGLAVLVSSTLVALRERPFRAPQTVAITTPVATDNSAANTTRETAPQTPVPPAEADSGPSIIRVDPDSARDGDGVIVIRDPSSVGQNPRLAHLPDKALLEETPNGPLPIRSADNRRPFDTYARAWSGTAGARIAVVIGGLGLSQTLTQRAIESLRPEVTLAFASAGNSLGRWMQTARREGHEIVLQVPMEPFGYPNPNPGRNTLTVDADAQTNLQRLHWALGRMTNYTGIMNYMGGRFTADAQTLDPVMQDIGARGLMYVDDGTSARSVARELALQKGAPVVVADAMIDPLDGRRAPQPADIRKKLDELERIARARGFAVGTGSAFGETIETVAAWADEVAGRGIELVPISAVALDPENR